MQKYVVKLNLSTFFNDERQNALVLVDPNWTSVKMLQERVETMFKVTNVRFQTNDGYFLPPEEGIEVVKFVDQLKAIMPEVAVTENLKKSKKKKKKEEGEKEQIVMELDNSHKESLDLQLKRKFDTLQQASFNCSTPNAAKRSKNFNFTAASTTGERAKGHTGPDANFKDLDCVSITKNSKYHSQPKEKKHKQKAAVASNNFSRSLKSTEKRNSVSTSHVYFDDSGQVIANDEIAAIAKIQTNNVPKKTLKEIDVVHFRCRLNEQDRQKPRLFEIVQKKPLIEIQEIIVLNPINNVDATKNSNDDNNNGNKTDVSHVVENSIQSNENMDTNTTALLEYDVSGEQQPIENQEQSNQMSTNDDSTAGENNLNLDVTEENQVMMTEAKSPQQEQLLEVINNNDQSLNSIDVDDDDDVDDTNASVVIDIDDDDDLSIVNESSKECQQSLGNVILNKSVSIRQILRQCTELKDLPAIGATIIFRMFLAQDSKINNCNNTSNYFVGKCDYINKRTKMMKIRILRGHEEVLRLPMKFQHNMDDSQSQDTYLNCKFSDLLSAKVYTE